MKRVSTEPQIRSHACRSLAEKVFDLDLETVVGVHPTGPEVVAHVDELLETHNTQLDRPVHELFASVDEPTDEEPVTLEELAERYARRLRVGWEEILDE